MEPINDKVSVYNARNTRVAREKIMGRLGGQRLFYRFIAVAGVLIIWQLAANQYNNDFLLPSPWKTALAFVAAVSDIEVINNLMITMKRVVIGFSIAMLLGIPLGFLMGYSLAARQIFDPLIDSVRQVPIMAWVPLTIVWFGLGDGPTIFLIAFSGIFPVIINTIAGVQGISKDYYNAARSMGAGSWSIFRNVIFPGSLPDILTGGRIAIGLGWMSVI